MKGIEKSSRVLGLGRFSMVQLLIALVLLFFFVPFVEEIKGGALIVSGLLSLVLISAVLAVANHHRTLIIALSVGWIFCGPQANGSCGSGPRFTTKQDHAASQNIAGARLAQKADLAPRPKVL
jgi:hypothetical protein